MGSRRFRQSRAGLTQGDEPPARRQGRPRVRARSAIGACVLALAIVGGIFWAAAAVADDPGEPAAQARKASITISPAAHLDALPSLSVLNRGTFIPGKGKARNRTAVLGAGDEVLAALTGSLVPVAVESAGRVARRLLVVASRSPKIEAGRARRRA